ncbi:NmrA family NAD(P)-binding protein (plasmid) [Rhodococcoides fascians A21d2]|uniref:SDR family oxidoreductase n=1 Tax=Rhodococcoides fascians TaxID=1828 RepID=UPI00056BBEAB|nr:NmrA family NAD(P)-binding protein [Rhodococcus fascians]QII03784.1 NmrA family NAD(P)-binding protein [Rhodococcus fascians A21d2]
MQLWQLEFRLHCNLNSHDGGRNPHLRRRKWTHIDDQPKTIAAIGCSGHVSEPIVRGLLLGAKVRLLARNAELLTARYPDATIIEGSMMNAEDVARAMEGADAAFLMTPMARRNNSAIEVACARSVITGAQLAQLEHLIYSSAVGAAPRTGVGLLEAKYENEGLIAESGIPHSILRCGGFMQDIFDPRKAAIKAGRFLYPVSRSRRFSYTDQEDIAPFVIQHLLERNEALNRVVDFVDPETYSISEIEAILSQASGRPVNVVSRFPALFLLHAAQPFFHIKDHRFASIIPLLRFFDRHGCVATGETVGTAFPKFEMTGLRHHLELLLQ